jgi:uncharacterized protein (DUF427 family)
MAQAKWNDTVVAESDDYEVVEGNIYFPPDAIHEEYFESSDHHTTCGWKGEASYYHLVVDGQTHENAAWYYPDPKEAASQIEGYVAFWRDVEVEE